MSYSTNYENNSTLVETKPSAEYDSSEITCFNVNLLKNVKNHNGESGWALVEDVQLRMLILKVFADSDNQKILSLISETPLSIPEILNHCKMPLTLGYRKINSLIKNGFIVPQGVTHVPKKRDVLKYVCVFEDMKLFMDKNSIMVSIKLKK